MEDFNNTIGEDGEYVETTSVDADKIYRANESVRYKNQSILPYQRGDRFTGRPELFKRKLSADAWCFAQTEPGVVAVTRDVHEFLDLSEPIPKERWFEFRLDFADRTPEVWLTLQPGLTSNTAFLSKYTEEASRAALSLRLITHETLYQDEFAYRNRLRAHAYLCDCSTELSKELEESLPATLEEGYQSVAELAQKAGADWLPTLVACTSLWVKRELRADPVSHVGRLWLVRR
jgi:hypothetical protein